MFLNRENVPARRAGQPWRDDAQALPEQTQGALEELERMRQLINGQAREMERLRDENRELRKSRPTDVLTIEKIRDYVKTIKAYETDMVKVVTDILYLIGEKS